MSTVKKDECEQYTCRLPATGWAVENMYGGKPCGFYPLTSPFPAIYSTRKEARGHAMQHERVIRVTIRRKAARPKPTPSAKE